MNRKATAAAFRRQQELMGTFAQGEWDGDALAGLQESTRTIAHLCRAIHHGTRGREETWKFFLHGLSRFTCTDTRLEPYALLRLIFAASEKHKSARDYGKLPAEWKIEDGFCSDSFLDEARLLYWIENLGIAQVASALSGGHGVFAPNGAHFRLAPVKKKQHTGKIKGTDRDVEAIEDELDDEETRRGDLSLAVSITILAPELIVPGETLIFSGTKFVMRDDGRGEDHARYLTVHRMEDERISVSTIDSMMIWNCLKPCSVRMIADKKS